jgi:redox-sensitive bicupin YhaK (pirin superfamily)
MRRMEKKVSATHRNPQGHWVGDGFPVRSLFSYDRLGRQLSPFLLLDYAGPRRFDPAAHPRGVGEHPHRGFETVTIVYRGEVAHRDSAGNGGVIGPGDVQWMTAASGILHEEFHSPEFTRRGGDLEMVQLWVNLPARHKMSAPSYQAIQRADIAEVALADGAGRLRVIAGDCAGTRGAAHTFTALNVWDGTLQAGRTTTLEVPDGHNAAVIVLHGAMSVNQAALGPADLAVLDPAGVQLRLVAAEDTAFLLLSGAPIAEPIAGYGPFVMNTPREIETAVADFQAGRFGRMTRNEQPVGVQ